MPPRKYRQKDGPAKRSVARKLKALRQNEHVSREEFLELMKPHFEALGKNHMPDHSALYRIENSKQQLTFIEAVGICRACGVSLEFLAEDLPKVEEEK